MRVRFKSQTGFSLIELMIVVAIIGILATIAVPNFNRFTGKAKQSEAKGALAAIYSGEKSFQAEWSQYFTDLRDIGYAPEGKTNYLTGFAAAVAAPVAPGFVGSTTNGAAGTCIQNTKGACFPGVQATGQVGPTLAGIPTAATAAGFVAGASSTFPGAAKVDRWQIDQNKVLSNIQDGLN